MRQEKISTLLNALYNDAIKPDSAWETYIKFYKMCLDQDMGTMEYLQGVVNMDQKQRLVLRNRIAEKGFELTPNELNQYIFILLLAIYDYTSDCHDEYK
jgi:hypothetical protein|tara:strand:- start:2964 stop:3260 length:297 start_codon:yes stop_codon:yes gene_type:complete